MRMPRQEPGSNRRKYVPPVARSGFDAQESRVAAAVPGGARVRGSGCSTRPTKKSDVVSAVFRVECKTTRTDVLHVERGYLRKITGEALATGKVPAFAFGFDNGREDWIGFPITTAQRMMRAVAHLLAGDVAAAQAEAEALPARGR